MFTLQLSEPMQEHKRELVVVLKKEPRLELRLEPKQEPRLARRQGRKLGKRLENE